MNSMIIFISIVVGIGGLCIAVWSIIDTRKKYYKEFVGRKSDGKH